MNDTAQTAAWSHSTTAKITPDHIERAHFLVGYDEPSAVRQPVATPSEDSIRLFAMAYGSDNPLFCDADYARGTRWSGVIAPGPMVNIMGAPLRGDPRPDDIARAKKGLLKNIHMYHSGTEWEWCGPIRAGEFSDGVTPRGKTGPQGPRGTRQGINDYTMWFASDENMRGDYYGYDGPCPPWNDSIVHHYVFTVYAVDLAQLPVNGTFRGPDVLNAMRTSPFLPRARTCLSNARSNP